MTSRGSWADVLSAKLGTLPRMFYVVIGASVLWGAYFWHVGYSGDLVLLVSAGTAVVSATTVLVTKRLRSPNPTNREGRRD